ncbi:hypothetical protein AB8A31_01135 [Tardiphaga sp. 804_B3_N1_9]|uniref:hypothetical protein n=1 Tax=Tardiphaga TaxID=1395974 RepID=UPI001586905A|nr:hypothetical protein [Tardiphaga robiniae]NUU41305.1 hypothetical protein [Tardiphaga robiniae]
MDDVKAFEMNRSISTGLLLIVPVFCFVVGHILLRSYEPIYFGFTNLAFGYDYDPSYAYLFNGAAVADLHSPGIVVHPGTTSFILIACYLRLYQAWNWISTAGQQNLLTIILSDPEAALRFVSRANMVLFAFCVLWLGFVAKQALRNTEAALLIQTLPILYAEFVRPGMIGAEATLMVFGVLLLSLFLLEWTVYRDDTLDKKRWLPFAIGLCIAAMLVAKITSAPLLLLLGAIESRRRLLLGVAGAVAGIVLLLLPILPGLLAMANWYVELATHTGQYGSGSTGVLEWVTVKGNASRLLKNYWLTGLLLVAASVIVASSVRASHNSFKERMSDWRSRFVIAALAASLLLTALVLKHFGFRYFVPCVIVSSLLLGLCIFLHFSELLPRSSRRAILAGSLACYAVWFAAFRAPELPTSLSQRDEIQRRSKFMQSMASLKAELPNSIWIGAYDVHDVNYAVAFGIGYAGERIARQMAGRSPLVASYNRWNNKFWLNGEWVPGQVITELVRRGKSVFMLLPNDLSPQSLDVQVQLERELFDGTHVYRVMDHLDGKGSN